MTGKKQLKIARTLLKNSQTSQLVDAKKVRSNIDLLSKERPRKLISILRAYKRLIFEALAKEEAQVESAILLTNQKQFEKELKNKMRVQRVKYKIRANLVIGARITHGDWVYDASLDSKLAQLING